MVINIYKVTAVIGQNQSRTTIFKKRKASKVSPIFSLALCLKVFLNPQQREIEYRE